MLIIVEYFLNLYTFSIIIEIAMIPLMIFIGLFSHYTKDKAKHNFPHKFANFVFGLIAFILIISSATSLKKDDVFSLSAAIQIFLPALLTIMFLPFLYFVAIYTSYEGAISRIKIALKNDLNLTKYAIKNLILIGGLRLKHARKVAKIVSREIWNTSDLVSVDILFEKIKIGNQLKVGDDVILLATNEPTKVLSVDGEMVTLEFSDGPFETIYVGVSKI